MMTLRLLADDLTGALDTSAELVPLVGPVDTFWAGSIPVRPASLRRHRHRHPGEGRGGGTGRRGGSVRRHARRNDRVQEDRQPPPRPDPAGTGGLRAGRRMAPRRPGARVPFPGSHHPATGGSAWPGTAGGSRSGPIWPRPSPDLGLRVQRGEPGRPLAPGISVFDAESDADLNAIVAHAGATDDVLWCGTGGLAQALAAGRTAPAMPHIVGPGAGVVRQRPGRHRGAIGRLRSALDHAPPLRSDGGQARGGRARPGRDRDGVARSAAGSRTGRGGGSDRRRTRRHHPAPAAPRNAWWSRAARPCAGFASRWGHEPSPCGGACFRACRSRRCGTGAGMGSPCCRNQGPLGQQPSGGTCCRSPCSHPRSKGRRHDPAPPGHHHGRPGRDRPRNHRQGRRPARRPAARRVAPAAGDRQQRRARAGAAPVHAPTCASWRSTTARRRSRRWARCRPAPRAPRSGSARSPPRRGGSHSRRWSAGSRWRWPGGSGAS